MPISCTCTAIEAASVGLVGGCVELAVVAVIRPWQFRSSRLAEVVDMFRTDAARHVRDLSVAVEVGDAERVMELAHALKGTLSFFGDSSVLEIVKQLEADAGRDDLRWAESLANRLALEYPEFDAFIQEVRASS